MKKAFIHALVLVLVTGSLALPTVGCFGDFKGASRSDDAVTGITFGGYYGVGMAYGFLIQFGRFPGGFDNARLTVGDAESRVLSANEDDSAIAYVPEQDMTLFLLHDDVNDVVLEAAIPGASTGRVVLPAGELDSPWMTLEVDGKRLSTSERAQVVFDIKQYGDEAGDSVAGAFHGRLEAEDGTLVDVSGNFSGPRVQ